MYKESTLHIIAINFFWSLMEKTVRGLCVCARVCVRARQCMHVC